MSPGPTLRRSLSPSNASPVSPYPVVQRCHSLWRFRQSSSMSVTAIRFESTSMSPVQVKSRLVTSCRRSHTLCLPAGLAMRLEFMWNACSTPALTFARFGNGMGGSPPRLHVYALRLAQVAFMRLVLDYLLKLGTIYRQFIAS